ncbi:hypothetical protein [Alteribacter populi]|uniref:hypothetical protein n=1 Tax=Alteribacter populi TaxID=2011011 RepID=UPI000BBB5F62|nr:hypothetical protein [Alteribacter populi]
MKKETKNRLVVAILLISTAIVVWYNPFTSKLNDQDLYDQYIQIVSDTSELFQTHNRIEEAYFNESFGNKEAIHQHLGERMTDDGLQQLVSSLFRKEGPYLVYNDDYQIYLQEVHLTKEDEHSYYNTVKDTLLNPGLLLIQKEDMTFSREGDKIEIQTEETPVYFFNQDDIVYDHQFKRFGYPPVDRLTITFTFTEEEGDYLLDHFKVQSQSST